MRRAVAQYDYPALERDELSLKKGDLLIILRSPEAEEGWFEGQNERDGRTGLFPANYVRELSAAQHEALADPPPTRKPEEKDVEIYRAPSPQAQEDGWVGSPQRQDRSVDSAHGGEERSPEQGGHTPWDRLYTSSIHQARRQQLEEKSMDSREADAHQHKIGARSRKMASNRRPGQGNYGEFLYSEGQKRRQFREEQLEMMHEMQEQEEVEETTFTPQISKMSRALKRDMPVVERLLMMDQVKEEKLNHLKMSRELEEGKDLIFTPSINRDYDFKEGQRNSAITQHQRAHHIERETKRLILQERFLIEEGVTHQPSICEKSRELARKGASDADTFSRLYEDAEKRKHNMEVRKIEAQLSQLSEMSQASVGLTPRRRCSPSRANGAPSEPSEEQELSLYERAGVQRLRREIVAREAEEQYEKDAHKGIESIRPKSRELYRERYIKDMRAALEELGIASGGVVSYHGLIKGISDLVDVGAVRADLEGLSKEELEVLVDRIWIAMEPQDAAPPEKGYVINAGTAQIAVAPTEHLLALILQVEEGNGGGLDSRPPVDVGKAALSVFEEFVRKLMYRRMSRTTGHARKVEKQGLETRIKQLRAEGDKHLTKMLRNAGLKLNDTECSDLYQYFNLDGKGRLDYTKVEHSGTSRGKTIGRMLGAMDKEAKGWVSIEDFEHSAGKAGASTPRGADRAPKALRDTVTKLSEVEKRLAEVVKYVSEHPEQSAATSPLSTPRTHANAKKKRRSVSPRRNTGEGVPRHEQLHQLARVRFEALFTARQQQEDLIMEQCTFRPNTNKHPARVSAARRTTESVRQTAQVMSTEERELLECTFKPKITKSRPPDSPHQAPRGSAIMPSPRGKGTYCTRSLSPHKRTYASSRSKGDSYKSPRQQASTPGSTKPPTPWSTQSKGDGLKASRQGHLGGTESPPRTIAHERSASTPPRQNDSTAAGSPQTAADSVSSASTRPILCVDVNLGGGKTGRIFVHEGDDAASLAETFAASHGLEGGALAKLESILAQHMLALSSAKGDDDTGAPTPSSARSRQAKEGTMV